MANHFRSTERHEDGLDPVVGQQPTSARDDMEAAIDAVLYQDAPKQAPVQDHPVVTDIPQIPTVEELEAEAPAAQNVYAQLGSPAPSVPHEGTPTISLKNVTHIYPSQPNKPALEDVSLDIYPGEFVFVVGHSGSGKSTFIRLLTRELRASKGQVLVAGQDLTRMRNWKVPYLRRQIGCVFQDFKLLPDKTTYENVAFALE